VWLDELKDTRPGKGYDLAFNFLLAEGLIDAPPASAAPSREPAVPPEQVFEKLSAWMTQSGICVSTYSSSCPTTFAKRVTPSYLARASYVRPSPEPNVQWSARATYLNEPAIHDGSVAAAGE
jgi:hypothetical protein